MLKRVNNRNRNNEHEPGAMNAREPGAANAREPGAANAREPGAANAREPGAANAAAASQFLPANTTSISQLPSFRDASRAESLALLAGQFNTYMFRKSSLFPNDDNVYVVSVCFINDQSRPDFSHLLISQRLSRDRGREYMYVTEKLAPEAGSAAWSNKWFNSLHGMIKARFPGIVGPAALNYAPLIQAPAVAAPTVPMTTTSISQWACFRDVSRAETIKLLNGQFNTYMFRKSSLFPNDDNVYVVSVHFLTDQNRPDFAHLLITQRLSQDGGREYMYVTETLEPEPGSPAWYNTWFSNLHQMIKMRFPAIVGPALLQNPAAAAAAAADPAAAAAAAAAAATIPKGGRRKIKKSNRMSRHKSTKKSNRTMLRKQTRRTLH